MGMELVRLAHVWIQNVHNCVPSYFYPLEVVGPGKFKFDNLVHVLLRSYIIFYENKEKMRWIVTFH